MMSYHGDLRVRETDVGGWKLNLIIYFTIKNCGDGKWYSEEWAS